MPAIRELTDQDRAFLADVERRPGDRVPLLVYADWLAERGLEDGERCCRWMAKREKWPARRERYLPDPADPGRLVSGGYRFAWYPEKGAHDLIWPYRLPPEGFAHALLPKLVFVALKGRRAYWHTSYPSFVGAFEGLCLAFGGLREAMTP